MDRHRNRREHQGRRGLLVRQVRLSSQAVRWTRDGAASGEVLPGRDQAGGWRSAILRLCEEGTLPADVDLIFYDTTNIHFEVDEEDVKESMKTTCEGAFAAPSEISFYRCRDGESRPWGRCSACKR